MNGTLASPCAPTRAGPWRKRWDHCFEGPARALPGGRALRLAWSSAPLALQGAVLYLPEASDFFCEPVTACPNALTAADPAARGVVALAPGESLHSLSPCERKFAP